MSETRDELRDKINDCRRRIVRGEEVSDQEISENIARLQAFRQKAAAPKATSKTASKPKGKSTKAADAQKAKDLLGDLL